MSELTFPPRCPDHPMASLLCPLCPWHRGAAEHLAAQSQGIPPCCAPGSCILSTSIKQSPFPADPLPGVTGWSKTDRAGLIKHASTSLLAFPEGRHRKFPWSIGDGEPFNRFNFDCPAELDHFLGILWVCLGVLPFTNELFKINKYITCPFKSLLLI